MYGHISCIIIHVYEYLCVFTHIYTYLRMKNCLPSSLHCVRDFIHKQELPKRI